VLTFKSGDIFESGCEVLINPVNCVGVMGKGLALQFKNRFPLYFSDYNKRLYDYGLSVGELHVWHGPSNIIVSFPTKMHWKHPSRLEYIEKGLEKLVDLVMVQGNKSIAIPALGCGLGELQWADVKALIISAFEDVDSVEVVVYEPQ
jgi:O-acetyl-ADP-ribose deacetylase (regulator of RNase III)